MTDSPQNLLVAEIAKDLLTEVAPQERALFRATSEMYFKNPEKMQTAQGAKDEMLGFGVSDAMELITPALLAISGDVIRFLWEEATKAMKGESTEWIAFTVKSWFGKVRNEKKDEKKAPPPLTPEQLEQVRKIAIRKAKQLKLSEKNTKMLADAIVGSLATSSGRR